MTWWRRSSRSGAAGLANAGNAVFKRAGAGDRFGPGHLQVALNEAGMQAFGLDESRQMGRQARRRLCRGSTRNA